MSARKTFGGVLVGALATASVIAGSVPAHAAVDPDDTTFTPASADLVGVGSDTSQHALKRLADAWNGATPAPTSRLATYAATGGGDVVLPGGTTIPRPNGSGAGKGRLYGANNAPEVDFARSSSPLNQAEVDAGLKQFPFALDVLKTAVSGSSSNAPTAISAADLVKIYDGTYTNWNQLGGSNGTIVPMIPQAGSGTRSFFEAQLKAANGNNAVVLAASVQEVQEHDPAPIAGNANAVAPFSAGRAGLAGNALRLEGGFEAQRALYNVVRGTDVAKPEITAVFGPSGFLCSEQAQGLIKAAGFDQLATPTAANPGVCGVQTTAATIDFDISGPAVPVATSAAVSGTSAAAGKAAVKATISGSKTPEGTVTFTENGAVVAANVPLIGGTATANLSGLTPGAHTYKAVFAPKAGTVFQASEATGSVTVKTSASLSKSFKAKAKFAKKIKGSISVSLAGTATPATGTVTIKVGSKVVGKGTVSGGVAKVTLKGLKKGKNELVATWSGDALAPSTTLAFTIKLK